MVPGFWLAIASYPGGICSALIRSKSGAHACGSSGVQAACAL